LDNHLDRPGRNGRDAEQGGEPMKKLLIGGVAVVVLAVAGYFGVTAYAKQRAEREVAATFEAVRANGGTASHGKVDFDLWSRTLTVSDIAVQPAGATQGAFKAARVVATGVGQPAAGQLSAKTIEISGIEANTPLTASSAMQMTYRVPSIRLDGYSGPAGPLRKVDASSALDLSRLIIEHVVATTATAIAIPSLTMTFAPEKAGGQLPAVDYVYSDIAVRELRDGRVAAATIGKMEFKSKSGPQMSGAMERFAASEIDIGATLAMFDPAAAKDERPRRMYKQVTVGPYTAAIDPGVRMRIESMQLDDMGIVPAKLPISEILAIVEAAPPPGTTPSPAATRALLEKIAVIYEGMTIGKFEMRGMTMGMPDGEFKLATIRIDSLAQGRFAEFALEGLDGETRQKQPVKVGRFAFKGLDMTNLMRMSGRLAGAGQQPGPDQLVAMLKLLEGLEIKDLQAPYEKSATPVRVDTFAISWGQYVGPIPSQARLTVKTSGPIEQIDDEPFLTLATLGFKDISATLDLGAQWTEGTRVFAVTPAAFEIADLLATSTKISLGNVSSDMFSLDPVKVMQASAGIETGPVEVTLTDMGAVDLAVRQFADIKGVTRAAALAELIGELKQTGTVFSQASPGLAPVFAAAARFMETPRSTLTVKITPNGRVGLLELMQLSPEQALGALSRFTIEASVK
jgi:hypothetical protein